MKIDISIWKLLISFFPKVFLWFCLGALHSAACSATRQNLNKTLGKNENRKFSYRNIEFHHLHLGWSLRQVLELVYTKYEVNRSIIKEGGRIQPDNPVFSTLTMGVRGQQWGKALRVAQPGHAPSGLGPKRLSQNRVFVFSLVVRSWVIRISVCLFSVTVRRLQLSRS